MKVTFIRYWLGMNRQLQNNMLDNILDPCRTSMGGPVCLCPHRAFESV